MTYEISNTTRDQMDHMRGFLGLLVAEVERLDGTTFNITVPDDRADDLSEYCEERDIVHRLV